MSVTAERLVSGATSGAAAHARVLRLGFAGVGWIGRHRMRAVLDSGHAVVDVVFDPAADACAAAVEDAPGAAVARSFDELLERDLDGVVIATPSALHAQQAIAALERGLAVFCQKPLARTAAETRAVVAAAKRADRLLGVDMSYRYTRGMQLVRDLIMRGELGAVYAADLVFHNGYGPDKPWFYDTALSGGGCLMDLGVHLVDLALWALGFPRVTSARGSLFEKGELLASMSGGVEDYAIAELKLDTTSVVRVACSWRLAVGADALISAQFHGTSGGAEFRNVNGSFYDFEAYRYAGTQGERLTAPPDAWGGRAAVAWADQLRVSGSFDESVEHVVQTAEVLDAVYGR